MYLLTILKNLIPPKGIKCKNQEDFELLNFFYSDDTQGGYFRNMFGTLYSNQKEVEEIPIEIYQRVI